MNEYYATTADEVTYTIVRCDRSVWIFNADSPLIEEQVAKLEKHRDSQRRRATGSDFARLIPSLKAFVYRKAYGVIETTFGVTPEEVASLLNVKELLNLTIVAVADDKAVGAGITVRL